MDNKQLFAAQALKDHYMGRIMASDDEGSTVQSEIHLMETGKNLLENFNLEPSLHHKKSSSGIYFFFKKLKKNT